MRGESYVATLSHAHPGNESSTVSVPHSDLAAFGLR